LVAGLLKKGLVEVVLLQVGLHVLATQLRHGLTLLQQLPHLSKIRRAETHVSRVTPPVYTHTRALCMRRTLVDEKLSVSVSTM
jgi:hypothetical protein